MTAASLVPGIMLDIPRAISGINDKSKTSRAVIRNMRSGKNTKTTIAISVPSTVHSVIKTGFSGVKVRGTAKNVCVNCPIRAFTAIEDMMTRGLAHNRYFKSTRSN
jgi:hypothetical protein